MKTTTDNAINLQDKKQFAGLFRRLFAIAYDCFLLIAVLFITSGLFLAMNRGEAVESGSIFYIPMMITLALIIFLYFTWFWVHGGQTLGLKTWRLRLVSLDNTPLDWKQAGIRFFSAIVSATCFGLGFIWSLFHGQRRTWHDLLSATAIIDLRYERPVASVDATQEKDGETDHDHQG